MKQKLKLVSIIILLFFVFQNVILVNAQDMFSSNNNQQEKTLIESQNGIQLQELAQEKLAEQQENTLTEQQKSEIKDIQDKLLKVKEAVLAKDKQPKARKNILIKYKKGAQKNFKKSIQSKTTQDTNRNIKKLFGEDIESMDLDDVEVKTLKQDSEVDFVEEDGVVQKSGKVSQESTDKIPWNISYVNADLVQEKGYSGKGINVAIFDTGIDTNNSDLKVDGGVSFVDGVTNYTDDNGHGTAMAGILSAIKNNSGLIGIAPKVNLYSVKVLDSTGSGNYSNIIKGIQWAIDNKMDIISMSFGGPQYSKILEEAIIEANSKNILVIAAAGNEGSNNVNYPAKYGKVVCVGAVDNSGKIASFSNRGSEMDISAPGVGIETYAIGNKTAIVSGTSPAVPHVAGVAAQILSAKKKLQVDDLKAILYNSTTPVPNMNRDSYGWGIINAYNSLENINTPLKLNEDNTNNVKFIGQDSGTDGNVHMSFIIYGDNQTISVGQTAEVRGGFNSAHNQLEISVETTSGTRLYPVEYRFPISGNGAYVTYTTPVFTNVGQYIVRYHCSDNIGSTYDDLFHITVNAVAPPPPPPPTDDYGNSFSSAYNMSVNAGTTTSRNGVLEVANDVDFFKFTAPSTGLYTIYSSNNSVDVKGWLYNSSQTELTNNDDSNGTTNFSISYSLTQGQVYYVKVSHYNQNGTGSYTLNITAPAVVIPDDYGNDFSTAYNMNISAGTTTSRNGTLEVANDVDFFKFTAPSTGLYTIYSSNISVDVKGWLYNGSQTELANNDDYNGTNFSISYTLTQGQVYYVKVSHYNQNGTGSYTLNITAPPFTQSSVITGTIDNFTISMIPNNTMKMGDDFFDMNSNAMIDPSETIPIASLLKSGPNHNIAYFKFGGLWYDVFHLTNDQFLNPAYAMTPAQVNAISGFNLWYKAGSEIYKLIPQNTNNLFSYYTEIPDGNGGVYRLFLSNLGSINSGSSSAVALVARYNPSQGINETQGKYYALTNGSWSTNNVYASLPTSGGGVGIATVSSSVYSGGNIVSAMSLLNMPNIPGIKGIDFGKLKTDICNNILAKAGMTLADLEPEETNMFLTGITIGLDDNYLWGFTRWLTNAQTYNDDYFYISGKTVVDTAAFIQFSAMTVGANAAAGIALTTSVDAAIAGGVTEAVTVGVGTPAAVVEEGVAVGALTVAAECKVAAAIATACAAHSASLIGSDYGNLGRLPPFNSGNFNKNLRALIGDPPSNMVNPQAHHVLPQKYKDFFNGKGIDIHDPKYGSWVAESEHLGWTYDYNVDWGSFISSTPQASVTQIENFAKMLSQKYGFLVHF